MMPTGGRALGWGGAFLFFLITGPISLYTYGVLTGPWQGSDDAPYPSTVLLPFLMVFPYVLWCVYFLIRGARGQAVLVEHFLIVLLFTPVLSSLASALVAAILANMGGFARDYPLWWLWLPILYLWQIAQFVVVQLLHKRQRDKTVAA